MKTIIVRDQVIDGITSMPMLMWCVCNAAMNSIFHQLNDALLHDADPEKIGITITFQSLERSVNNALAPEQPHLRAILTLYSLDADDNP